ncbi:MAG: hypothetical protein H8D82_00330 [Euryarchaeota archaeon]|nr:hypothetical protein [Euryarchaeota archaeon]
MKTVDDRLISLQSDVRDYFGWSVDDDRLSAEMLSEKTAGFSSLISSWEKISERLKSSKQVLILGAAVEVEDLLGISADDVIVAADGSVGVLSELPLSLEKIAWENLALIVSDGDGGDAMIDAAVRGIPFALHAHGDNVNEWKNLIPILDKFCETLILAHQTLNSIDNMFNPGGFTDGDRAACIVAATHINPSKIKLIGFRSDRIGRWTGITNPERKLRKLKWMEKVLEVLEEAGGC